MDGTRRVPLRALERQLTRALADPLPGVEAQLRMSPQPRPGWDPRARPDGLRHGAALLLVYPVERQAHVLLTVRGSTLRHHTGQVSLPGGAVDPDETLEDAALRESFEEVGLAAAAVRILGRLTPIHIPVSQYLLHPILGIADERPDFKVDALEVARILEVPVSGLREPAAVGREAQLRNVEGRTVPIEVPYFAVDGEKVWGATAMVLAEFLALVKDA
ncbi:MAG: NUDIX hydrolase [Acidobacteriota bacterium]